MSYPASGYRSRSLPGSSAATCMVMCACLVFGGVPPAVASPVWWLDRGVVNTNVSASDHAPVLQGQLRWFATNAFSELQGALPGGAGAEARAALAGSISNDYAAVSLGQLKQLASVFHRRLIEEGVAEEFPWGGEGTGAISDFAPAVVGQAKRVFDFSIAGAVYTPSINGAVTYSGLQSGPIQVVALPATGFGGAARASCGATGAYHVVVGRSSTHWLVEAWRDSNGDGQPDSWEAGGRYPANPVAVTSVVSGIDLVLADPDEDHDGIPGYVEIGLGLDPDDPMDGGADADGDGLVLADELRYGSNPVIGDSDGDGMGDGAEVANGYSPTNSPFHTRLPFTERFEPTSIMAGDLHGQRGWVGAGGGATVVTQSVIEGFQSVRLSPSTNSPASASLPIAAHGVDTVWIDFQAEPVRRVERTLPVPGSLSASAFYLDRDGRVMVYYPGRAGGEWVGLSNATVAATGAVVRFTVSHDYVRRVWGLWVGGSNVVSGVPFAGNTTELGRLRFTGASYAATRFDAITVTSNAPGGMVADSDYDGMPDEWEVAHGLDPLDPTDATDPSGSVDPDHDGLCNLDEFLQGLDPRNPDYDGDGWLDGTEVAQGTLPAVSNAGAFVSMPFAEDFEAPAVAPGELGGQHGWSAGVSGWATIQSSNRVDGLWAARLQATTNEAAVLTHPLQGVPGNTVWTDWSAIPVRRRMPVPPVMAPASVSGFYIDISGRPVVVDGTNWVVLAAAPVVSGTNWSRFTVVQDYSNLTWNLYVGGIPVATNLAFARPIPQYTGMRFRGGVSAESWIDAIRVTVGAPGGIDSDGDGDGLSNGVEFQYGTNPGERDSDHDGMSDGVEIARGFSPTNTDVYSPLPFVESFEAPLVTNGVLGGQHGWRLILSNGIAVVQGNTVFEGASAVLFGGSGAAPTLYRPVAAAGQPVVWSDWRARPVFRTVASPPEPAAASSVAFYVNREGRVVFNDGGVWGVATNVAPLLTNEWARFTTCQNYSNGVWSLYVNGWRAASGLALIRPVTEYSGFAAVGSTTATGALDSITVSCEAPVDIDFDGDGMPSDWEVTHHLAPSDPTDPTAPSDLAATGDPDHDGLSNLDEYRLGTDPHVFDSDGDGMGDGAEHGSGFDPACSNAFAALPVIEDFEAPAITNGPVGGQKGWISAGFPACVTNNPVFEGGQALALLGEGTVWHPFAAAGKSVVWIDYHARPIRRTLDFWPMPGVNSATALAVDSAGMIAVCTRDGGQPHWQVLSGHPVVSTSAWSRFSVRLDYSSQLWSVWLNGVRVAHDLAFARPVAEFSAVRMTGASKTAGAVDQLAITATEPAGLDDDGDGLPNIWEMAHGVDPSDPTDASDPSGNSDPDHDGLSNLAEYHLGTDPREPDSDHDGLADGADGVLPIGLLPDGIDRNGDGYADGEQPYGCGPLSADTDGDGVTDGAEAALGRDPLRTTLETGLIAWYRLDETNGTVLADSSGNGLAGEWVGAGPSGTVGRLDGALDFDGVTNRVWVPGDGLVRNPSNFTVSVWVRSGFDCTNADQTIVSQPGAWRLSLNRRRPEFTLGGAAPISLTSTSSLPMGAWTFLSATVGDGHVALYVDAARMVMTNGCGAATTNPLSLAIGGEADKAGFAFKGSVDDVRLYGRALSPEEISQRFKEGADPDGDTVGTSDELQMSTDPFDGHVPAGKLGDLDGDGRLTSRDLDRLRLLVSEMEMDVTRVEYDSEGNPVRRIDALGGITTTTYNGNNRPVSVRDSRGATTVSELNPAGAVTRSVDALGNATQFAYNRFGNVTSVTDAAGHVTRMTYNPAGQVIRVVNPLGIVTETTHDELGRIRCVVAAAGTPDEQRTWSFYDAGDNLVSNRNAIGTINEWHYDARGGMIRQVQAKGTAAEASEETEYDACGLPVSRKDALGHVSRKSYDVLSREVSATDPLGNVTRTEYNNLGSIIAVIQPNGHVVGREFDKWGREVLVRDGADTTSAHYDRLGRTTIKTDWRGIRTEYAYDAAGNVTNLVEAVGTSEEARTATVYDLLGRPVRTLNAVGQAVETAYDALGNKTRVTDALGATTRWDYRHDKRVALTTKPDGVVVSNRYDCLDRLVCVRVDGLVRQEFAYDAVSRMIRATDVNRPGGDAESQVVTFEYDELSRVVCERRNGVPVRRQFNAGGKVTQLTTPSGFILNRVFDANGRLSALKNAAGSSTYAAYSYTPNSRVRTIAYGNGVVETHGLDSRERLHTLVQQGAGCDFSATLARDPNGNVTMSSDNFGDGAAYTHDALNRVTARRSLDPLFGEALQYDRLGNWLASSNRVRGVETRTVDAANRYTQIGTQGLVYDPNGNLSHWDHRDFLYDFLNRLIEVRSNGLSVVRYGYDAMNRRVSKESGGTRTDYYYDGEALVDEATAGQWGQTTVHGETLDTPVVMVRGGEPFYYLRDWRANVAALTDAAGHPVELYRYSLFGEIRILDAGGTPRPVSQFGNMWTFAGRQWDPETGLMHNRNRAYSAALGRFLQPDPAGYEEGMNLYAYAGNNPLLFDDPYGLYRWSHGTLDERIGSWIFTQYAQLREIERQRREYEEALRRAEEERQRQESANRRAAEAFGRYKTEHAREVRSMVSKYRHLGVNEDEAARLLMSGVKSIPRLGATVGPNDTRRSWWLDYYLRGGRVNDTMRGEMGAMGVSSADEFFAGTSARETALRAKRKAKQTQITMVAIAIVATVVTCGAGGAVGAALLGTVGVSATAASFGAFVAGAVVIQGVAAAATTAISHGNLGDFAQTWAINSVASVAGYGAGFNVAKAGGDMALQMAAQSAASTFVAEGSRAAMEGTGFKTVFRDTAISFVAGGIMGTFMSSPGGKAPATFGDYMGQNASSSLGYLQSPVSGGVQGALHAAFYGGNIAEAFRDGATSREALTQFAMTSVVASAASWLTTELTAALPGTTPVIAESPRWREPEIPAKGHESAVDPADPGTLMGRIAKGSVMTVAAHLKEAISAPARAVGEMIDTAMAPTWRERSRLANPFSRKFIAYQVLDKVADAALVTAGLPVSFLSGDFMDVQRTSDMHFEDGRALVTMNGVFNGAGDAQTLADTTRRQYGVEEGTHVLNGTHGGGIGDALQILGNEFGLIDITAIRGARAIRAAGAGVGTIDVVAHSQGTMTFRRALDLVDDTAIRERIAYRGFGPQAFNSARQLGLGSAENYWNRPVGGQADPVPVVNYLPTPARMVGASTMMAGNRGWERVDSPGNQTVPDGNRHGYQDYYLGYANGRVSQ